MFIKFPPNFKQSDFVFLKSLQEYRKTIEEAKTLDLKKNKTPEEMKQHYDLLDKIKQQETMICTYRQAELLSK